MSQFPAELEGAGKVPLNWNRAVRLLKRMAGGQFFVSDGSVNIQADIAGGVRITVPSTQPLWVKLTEELYLGMEPEEEGEPASATAHYCRWDGDEGEDEEGPTGGWQPDDPPAEIEIFPSPDQTGYFFSGQVIRVTKCSANGRHYPYTNGFTTARCELSETLEDGGEASAVFADLGITDGDGDPSADVKDTILGSGESIASGQHVDVVWDVGLKAFKLSGARCAQVDGGD